MANAVTGEEAVHVDVLIIGAGLSGLTAAYHLQQKGVASFRVIEARDRVGGRTKSCELHTAHGTQKWDLGGQWVCSTQPNVLKLMEELYITPYAQYRDGQRIFFLPNGEVRFYLGDIPPAPTTALLQYKLMLNKIESLCKTVFPDHPESCVEAERWDSMTLGRFMQERGLLLSNSILQQLITNACLAIFGVPPKELSFLYFLQTCASGGGFLRLATATEGSAQSMKVNGTAHGISSTIVDKIGADNVILGDKVVSISQKDCDVCFVETSKGLRFKAKFVIVAIPPHQRTHMNFCNPGLPIAYHHLHRHYVSGHMMKWIFTYMKPFWRENNFSGEAFGADQPITSECDIAEKAAARLSLQQSAQPSNSSPPGLDKPADDQQGLSLPTDIHNPILYTFDASVGDGEQLHPALVVFVHPRAAALRAVISQEELKRLVLDQLARLFGEEAANPVDFAMQDWCGEDTAVNNASPGALVNYGKLRRQPFGRIHWAGTESATQWIGYMDGAVQAGRRAADEVIEKLHN